MPLSPVMAAPCRGNSSLAGIFCSVFDETSFDPGERARLRVISGPTCADLLHPFFAKIVKHAIITNSTLPTRAVDIVSSSDDWWSHCGGRNQYRSTYESRKLREENKKHDTHE